MLYSELLQQQEWDEKTLHILQRDFHRCQKCGNMGFHKNSLYICNSSKEFNTFFDGWSVENLSFAAFIDKEIKTQTEFEECDKIDIKDITEQIIHKDLHFSQLYACPSSRILEGFSVHYIYTYPYSTQPITASRVQRRLLPLHFPIETKNFATAKLYGGAEYILNQILTDKYFVRIEYKYPTHGYYHHDGDIICGNVILSVTHKNYSLSLYFYHPASTPIKSLNIHHLYYVKDKAPWEYENDALVTLCEECHRSIHRTSNIPVYIETKTAKTFYSNAVICDNCNGAGYLPQYIHVENGICFHCWGEGVIVD